jgi:hypothetical protein
LPNVPVPVALPSCDGVGPSACSPSEWYSRLLTISGTACSVLSPTGAYAGQPRVSLGSPRASSDTVYATISGTVGTLSLSQSMPQQQTCANWAMRCKEWALYIDRPSLLEVEPRHTTRPVEPNSNTRETTALPRCGEATKQHHRRSTHTARPRHRAGGCFVTAHTPAVPTGSHGPR